MRHLLADGLGMRQRKYIPLPLQEAANRSDRLPTAHDLSALLRSFIGSSTGSAYGAPQNASITRVQILRELVNRHPELTPLPAISKHAAMYPPRVLELREDLKPIGLGIQCYEDRVQIPGNRFKQTHSSYRIERLHKTA